MKPENFWGASSVRFGNIIMIRPAVERDAEILTKISFESKAYWDYPKEYFENWKNELTIRPDFIKKNQVFVLENGREVIGFYSVAELLADIEAFGIMIEKGNWLDHLFISPMHIGKGYGEKMFMHLRNFCKEKGLTEIKIFADPNSRGFYEKMGCKYIREFPSAIAHRTIPLFILRIDDC